MKKLKVLMFGWEFPPHISGGLGTACLGLTKGLAKNDVEVLFVMPKASGDEDPEAAKIINASQEEMLQPYTLSDDYLEHIQFMEIGSSLRPYLSPEVFASYWQEEQNRQKYTTHNSHNTFNFSAHYTLNNNSKTKRVSITLRKGDNKTEKLVLN